MNSTQQLLTKREFLYKLDEHIDSFFTKYEVQKTKRCLLFDFNDDSYNNISFYVRIKIDNEKFTIDKNINL